MTYRTNPKGRSSTKEGSSTDGGPSTMNSHSDGEVGSSPKDPKFLYQGGPLHRHIGWHHQRFLAEAIEFRHTWG